MSSLDGDSVNYSFASLVLPPPPPSIFSNFSKQIQNNEFDNNTGKNDGFENNTSPSNTYIKKLPGNFIALQDCADYMQFTREIVLLKNDGNDLFFDNFWDENTKENQLMRLFLSFHKLYKEYTFVYENYVSNPIENGAFGDVANSAKQSNKNDIIEKEIKYFDFSCQTETFLKPSQSNETLKSSISLNLSMFNNIRHFLQPAFNLGLCMKSVPKNEKIKREKYRKMVFDTIINENIDVFEKSEKNHKKVTHRITFSENNSVAETIELPIALELLLPKIQQKIDEIFFQCPFLCDPLEVISELRNFNYEQPKCVDYFQKTKHLRYLYIGKPAESIKPSENIERKPLEDSREIPAVKVVYKNISFSSRNEVSQVESRCVSRVKFPSLEKLTMDSVMQTEEATVIFMALCKNVNSLRQCQNEVIEDVRYLAQQLGKVFHSLKNHMITVINQCSERLINNEQRIRLLAFSRQVDELKIKVKEEEKKRRQVYNRMQEQMGNVRVYCRCRNLSDEENVLEYIGEDSLLLTTVSNEKFEFDKVFPPGLSQAELFEEFRPLVMSFIDGYNVCFITYGGEASGKTYTLIGDNRDSSHQGIMQRSLLTILTEEKLRQRDWKYKISACVVEIYNDNCIDILSGESGIQIYVDNGMEYAYQKLKSVPITNEADADVLIQVCTVKRKVARTALNPASSRSHLITIIRLEGRSKIHGENICSFLCLSDLAGFEDIIKAETQTSKILSKEAGYINRSLTAFNRVFVSLKKQDPNTVSYRDTKLTHILKPFLTNSGKCALIVTVRNDRRSIGSTHNTLRFGKETRGVTLGKARRQVNLNSHTSLIQ